MSASLTIGEFSKHLHSIFRASPPGEPPLALELIEVKERNVSPQVESFSLLFRGPFTPVLGQGIHTLQHEKLESLDLFLVPIGSDALGMCYEAVFNVLRDPPV